MEDQEKYNAANGKAVETPETLTFKLSELEKLADHLAYSVNASYEILESIRGPEAERDEPKNATEKETAASGILAAMEKIIHKMERRIAKTNRNLDQIKSSLY